MSCIVIEILEATVSLQPASLGRSRVQETLRAINGPPCNENWYTCKNTPETE